MSNELILVEQSFPLSGQVSLVGAKNAVLVMMASLILTSGKSILKNVPNSEDIKQMICLLEQLGASVIFNPNENLLIVDTSTVDKFTVSPEIMKKMRASILVMGSLLSRFGKANVALPGGCLLGARPIDLHLKIFSQMGVSINLSGEYLFASSDKLNATRIVLDYPSVGATENGVMASVLTPGVTHIINAAVEPEVLDLISLLKKMGANINVLAPATIEIHGVSTLSPIEHDVMPDRLEAGSLLLAAAITGGEIIIPNAQPYYMDVFLLKLQEMGHNIAVGQDGKGIWLKATKKPQAVSFKTMPYPGFPTDLQAPMIAALCLASGTSVITETVFENRMLHVRELQKMGAQIVQDGTTAIIKGVDELYGTSVIASDIRAACALTIAGLAAVGKTTITGVHHLKRGYQDIDTKIKSLGGKISIISDYVSVNNVNNSRVMDA